MSPEQFNPDNVVTPSRAQGLATLPAHFARLEDEFASTQDTQAFIDWGLRTKRIVWDQHQAAYTANPKFKGPKA
jgi:hypothetical protein